MNNPVSLKKPSTLQLKAVKLAMCVFTKYFKLFWVKRRLPELLYTKILNNLHQTLPNWFTSRTCDEHRYYIIHLLIRILIYKECKYTSADAKVNSKTEKLKIVKNL